MSKKHSEVQLIAFDMHLIFHLIAVKCQKTLYSVCTEVYSLKCIISIISTLLKYAKVCHEKGCCVLDLYSEGDGCSVVLCV